MAEVFIHPTAVVDQGAEIGEGSYIWHFVHVRSTAKIGKNVIIGKGSYIDSSVIIGDNTKIQNFISVYNGVTIGKNVFVGPHVTFTNDMYPRVGFNWEITKTEIKDNASIGANATIVCGSILEEYSFIAAGTLIPANRRIWKHALVMGNPGRIRGWVCRCGRKLMGEENNGIYEKYCTKCEKLVTLEVKEMGKL